MGFQVAAVIILLVFYGCYFGKMLMQKQKGIQTDQIGKGKIGLVKGIELTMKVITICVPIVEVVSIFLNTTALPIWARYSGILMKAFGDEYLEYKKKPSLYFGQFGKVFLYLTRSTTLWRLPLSNYIIADVVEFERTFTRAIKREQQCCIMY